MSTMSQVATLACAALLATACSTPMTQGDTKPASQATSAQPSTPGARVVKSRDGSFTGEIIGTPAASSKFAKLQIGMSMADVQEALGRSPDRSHGYESGKRWIPFYFGNDARRLQALYRTEGCRAAGERRAVIDHPDRAARGAPLQPSAHAQGSGSTGWGIVSSGTAW